MFHTIMLNYVLTLNEFSAIFEDQRTYAHKNGAQFYRLKNTNTYISCASSNDGVTWYLISNNQSSPSRYYSIAARINPKVLLGNKDYISVARTEDIELIGKKFDKLSANISKWLPNFNDYNLKRVDYCINIDVSNIGIPPEKMMDLICRADKPSRFNIWQVYNKKSHRKKPGDGSFYLLNDSLHINCYYKKLQLERNLPDCIGIEEAKSIIRFEVQCLQPKIINIKKAMEFTDDMLFNMLSSDTSMKYISKYYVMTIGYEPYYTLKLACKAVLQSGYKDKTKEGMIKTLQLINSKRGIWKARESLFSDKDIRWFKKSLKRIRSLGINPVTIPHSYGVETLPNLIDKIGCEQFYL